MTARLRATSITPEMDDSDAEPTPAAAMAAQLEQLEQLRSNVNLTDATTVPLLSPEECAEIVAGLDDDGWREMEVWAAAPEAAARGAHRREALPDVRRGRLRTAPGGNNGELVRRITEQVFDVNRRIYRFRLVGVEHSVQLLWYSGESADGYIAHMDIGPSASLRKLSFSLLLSDPATFDGGDLAFGAPFALARAQGTLTIFPSFLQHAVTPVTRGDRHAVVGFAIGPAFV